MNTNHAWLFSCPKKEANMHIRDYKYTAEDVDCRYCTEFRHGRCRAIKCPWLNERIEAGIISYHDAVNESFSSRSPLLRRIRLVLTFYDKSFWKDDDHFRRFQQADAILGFYKSRNTSEYYSALFLLTADHSLFLRFLDCFNRRGINFDLANLKGITPEHYALYKIAKSLYSGTAEVGVDELADPELVNTESFHIEFVISCLKENTTKVRNIKQYLLTTLYNAPRLPVHVRCLIDEAANIGQIPNLEKLVATIRSREISACLVLQAQSQLKALYKDNADTIIGNMDSRIFLGGSEPTTLKELNQSLGKETIDTFNTGESRGREVSHSLNYQKLGKDLATIDELAVLDGGKCILQLRGVRPFMSNKFDITKHPNYKYLSDADPKNNFDIEKYLSTQLRTKPDDVYHVYEVDASDVSATA